MSSAAWLEELTEEERAAEEKKKKEREEKAVAAQKQQLKKNQYKEWQQKEQDKEDRKKKQEDLRWQKQVEQAKQQAAKEGVIEAEDWGDGTWWAKLPEGTYKEVQGQYFCPHCTKHLNDTSLASHLESQAHKNKLSWQAGSGAAAPAASSPAAPSGSSGYSGGSPPTAPKTSEKQGLEDWQELGADGWIRCVPCGGKCVDGQHEYTDAHRDRLARWKAAQETVTRGYPAPELPYLAWVPCDEADPSSERWQKCLLCDKWVQDETSHSGTHLAPVGSKEHQKNLRNYPPGDPWYEERIKLRAKYHPGAVRAPTVRTSQPAQPPKAQVPQVATPAPWAAAAASRPPPPRMPPAAAQILPPGWSTAKDEVSGDTYYYHEATRQTQWDPPMPDVEEA